MAVLERRRVHESWKSVLIGQDEMIVAVAKDHPLAGQRSLDPRALDNLPMAIFDTTFLQRELLDRICKKANVKYRVVMQSNFVFMLIRAIGDNVGAGTLLRSVADADPRLASISFAPKQILKFSVCWRNDHYLSKPNKAFVEVAVARSAEARAQEANNRRSGA